MKSLSKFLIALFIMAIVSKTQTKQKFPNIGFLQKGYDVVKANPKADNHDPGFGSSNIFTFTYRRNNRTADGRFLIPDNVEALKLEICSFHSTSKQMSNERHIRESFQQDVKADFGGWGFSFSADVSYRNMREQMKSKRSNYFHSTAKCIVSDLSLPANVRLSLSEGFRRAASNLNNENDYYNLIKDYGTHYVQRMIMGAKHIVTSIFEQDKVDELAKEGIRVEAAATFSYIVAHGSVESLTDKEKEEASKFSSSRSTFSEQYQGAKPSTDRDWKTWAKSADDSPYPMEITLLDITRLITKLNFPNWNNNRLRNTRNNLAQALRNYCANVDHCNPLGGEWVDTRPTIHRKSGTGNIEVRCLQGQVATHCGTVSNDYIASSYLSNYRTCKCNIKGQGECVVNCIYYNARKITRDVPKRAEFLLNCGSSQQNANVVVYPHANGCRCNSQTLLNAASSLDSSKSTCHGTWARGVFGHEVISKRVNGGATTIRCPEKKDVISCYLRNERPLKVKDANPTDRRTCRCNANGPYICHAVCGNFIESSYDSNYFEFRYTSYGGHTLEVDRDLKGNRFLLEQKCDQLADCVAYTTEGEFKSGFAFVTQWNLDNPRSNLYIKDTYNKFKNKEDVMKYVNMIASLDK